MQPDDLLERWMDAYQPLVYRAAWLILRDAAAAEDVAQETFIRAYRGAGKLTGETDVRPWLFRIATNLALNVLRSRKRESAALSRVGAHDVVESSDVDSRREVVRAVQALPDRLRVPVILRYYLDMSEREIASALGIRPGTVKSRLFDARQTLAGDEGVAEARVG